VLLLLHCSSTQQNAAQLFRLLPAPGCHCRTAAGAVLVKLWHPALLAQLQPSAADPRRLLAAAATAVLLLLLLLLLQGLSLLLLSLFVKYVCSGCCSPSAVSLHPTAGSMRR
jgi:hypothetical protein